MTLNPNVFVSFVFCFSCRVFSFFFLRFLLGWILHNRRSQERTLELDLVWQEEKWKERFQQELNPINISSPTVSTTTPQTTATIPLFNTSKLNNQIIKRKFVTTVKYISITAGTNKSTREGQVSKALPWLARVMKDRVLYRRIRYFLQCPFSQIVFFFTL